MDLDEQDDVLLARLLKKVFVFNVAFAKSADSVISARSWESSSSKDVFIPTPDDVTSPNPHSKLAPVPVDEFTETEGRIDVSDDETSVNDENVEPTNSGTTNTVEPNVHNDFQLGTQQSPKVSRRMGKKFQQNRRNITTKTGRKKIPRNIPSVPIDEISFYLEENVQ
ncbi:uncharacterized protein E6C27_scaffold67G002840 [Cucumis melo var. makuwa]|uniref:Uncharacterized protein n=1 Tax=Cucumis melo var. makuwa TaxID=1194695 RepID=A0A5A7TJJ3_CUCMM|nr:uncharacterized protein E6C27_scaffold67G002840 [Cucumis melo var. makuwa]